MELINETGVNHYHIMEKLVFDETTSIYNDIFLFDNLLMLLKNDNYDI